MSQMSFSISNPVQYLQAKFQKNFKVTILSFMNKIKVRSFLNLEKEKVHIVMCTGHTKEVYIYSSSSSFEDSKKGRQYIKKCITQGRLH